MKRARWDTVICIAIGFGRDCCARVERRGILFLWGRGGGEGEGKGRRGFCSERVTLFQPSLPTLVVLAPWAFPELDIQIVADLQHCHFQILHLLLEESQSNHVKGKKYAKGMGALIFDQVTYVFVALMAPNRG